MTEILSVAILGATGSVGQNTLNVIGQHPSLYRVFALSGYQNLTQLLRDIEAFSPKYVVVPHLKDRQFILEQSTLSASQVLVGPSGLVEVASHPDVNIVMASIVGFAGLQSTLAAAKAGKKLLLANKESLVVAGALMMDAVSLSNAQLIPIDSEHNAIFQCLPGSVLDNSVDSILLTASGGPFYRYSMQQMQTISPAQAVAHPKWSMGKKISVDSATLMNKGLELIEACWLFSVQPSQIEVVIHPQSIIHSMVRFLDGSVIAHMSEPDMRIPIAYGLAYPKRIRSGVKPLSFSQILKLEFDQPDRQRFPCLGLAEYAFEQGGTLPASLNASNEVSVEAFLQGHISFMQIAQVNEMVMERVDREAVESLDQLFEIDAQARQVAQKIISKLRG